MGIKSVEVISQEAATDFRRQARRQRREEQKRFDAMTMRDVSNLFEADLSTFRACRPSLERFGGVTIAPGRERAWACNGDTRQHSSGWRVLYTIAVSMFLSPESENCTIWEKHVF